MSNYRNELVVFSLRSQESVQAWLCRNQLNQPLNHVRIVVNSEICDVCVCVFMCHLPPLLLVATQAWAEYCMVNGEREGEEEGDGESKGESQHKKDENYTNKPFVCR